MTIRLTLLFFVFFIANSLIAQVVTTEPVFPKVPDDVTIYFDAKEGNGALAGHTGAVYAHTGVIIEGKSGWQNVIGNWGTPDGRVLMNALGNDRYSLSYNIRDFYSIANGDVVEQLTFVFRDVSGNTVGRDTDGSDIFMPVYADNAALLTTFVSPTESSLIVNMGESLVVNASASINAELTLTDNGVEVARTTGATLQHTLQPTTAGAHTVEFVAVDGSNVSKQSFQYIVPKTQVVADPPADTEAGITYLSGTEVMLALYAPNKGNVFVIGDFNDWALDTLYQMNKNSEGNLFWLELEGLNSGEQYAFQYLVDGSLKIADPYSTTVLDPSHDGSIPAATYPNLPAYPAGKTNGIVSVLQTDAPAYNWVVDDFEAPEIPELVIYELLIRDFLAKHDYQTLLDTLDYLDDLGINAIELMPINEFEGNNSWGYNPSFHMALDKYYGPVDELKRFIDEAHSRGIAIILDVVYNHAFSQSPLAQLYWDPIAFKPRNDNPWLNPDARHPFNVGYDFNHESQATKDFVERMLRYWLQEFRVDGFRFDLSKGFTQVNSGGDVGLWGKYDASRIAILKNYADVIWAENSKAYVSMEHFSENQEEKELADYGMLFWNNMNNAYNEATMGYGNNLIGTDYKNRGWDKPHLITYMESHDEERLMYKNLQFGNASPDQSYNVKNLETALDRVELASAFFYTIPGPKLLWQFGEVGYDQSINRCPNGTIDDNCRVDPKPIRWNYFQEQGRRDLYEVTQELIHLKTNYDVFNTTDYNLFVTDRNVKRVQLSGADFKVNVLGNFDMVSRELTPQFQEKGWWYEYFSGDSLNVMSRNEPLTFEAGEYRLYTTKRLTRLNDVSTSTADLPANLLGLQLFPNPVDRALTLAYELKKNARVIGTVYNLLGQEVTSVLNEEQGSGYQQMTLPLNLASGTYLLRLSVGDGVVTRKFVVQ